MDEEEVVVKNVTRMKENRIKAKSKQGEKSEESSMGIHERHNINDVDSNEHVQVFGKDKNAEMKRECKKDKVKKNNKNKDFVADVEQGTEEGELTVAYGDDNVERKRNKRERNKTSNAKEVEEDENKKMLGEDADKERNKRKVKRKHKDGDFETKVVKDGKDFGRHSQFCEGNATEMAERKEGKEKNKLDNSEAKQYEGNSSLLQQKIVPQNVEGNIESTKHDENATKELERKKKTKKKKKKKKKKEEHCKDNSFTIENDYGVECKKKEKSKKTKSNDATPLKSNKKVKYFDQEDFLSIPGNSNTNKLNYGEENLVRGKWFTPEEDKIVTDAVLDYIERHVLGEEGLDMVLNSIKHPKLRGCWNEIASAIPYRPKKSIYSRAQMLFHRSEERKWTQEEFDEIRKHQGEHGNKWKGLAEKLGKHSVHVKDAWRRTKLIGRKKGPWSQEEYQKLFNLVNVDLQAKLSEEKKSMHGMLRDNVSWTAISDVMSTRPQWSCCWKWYRQLTSRMVADGEWADTDDYRLVGALYSLDATCMEDVEWGNLVEGRTGSVCRKRWNQMVLHIGEHGHKPFAEQVDVLAQRYCPNLLEAREIWDSKPRVP